MSDLLSHEDYKALAAGLSFQAVAFIDGSFRPSHAGKAIFAGYKQSGFGGRDNALHAHDQYAELKTIWIDLSDPDRQDSAG